MSMNSGEPSGFKFSVVNINPTSELAYEDDLRTISRKASKQDLILYFGREEFSDNSKYLFLHAVAQPGGHRHVWCCFNKKLIQELRHRGLEAFDLGENVNRTIQVLLRAKIAVFTLSPSESLKSRIFLAALAGAQKVQLWHGIGIKRMEMQNIEHKDFLNLATVARMRWATEIDCIVSPSEPFDRHWQETFGVERVIRAGYPRNEVLLRAATALELINVPTGAIKESPRRKVLIVPTWGTAGERHWSKYLDNIGEVARQHDLEIYLKPHPYEAAAVSKYPSGGGGRLTVLPATMDLYPLLNRFSCMITDHSSMAFDAFLLDMSLIFLKPNDTRFYMTEMLEPKVAPSIETFDELRNFPALLEEAAQCRENRALAARRYFETPPLAASQTIHETIRHLMRAA
jgi:CDP-glycerol glycerophosphotransferase (TagB/SpsB family)